MSTRPYASPRRTRAAAETREAVLAAALQLFESNGYAATSMAEVAATAGVSLNTIYVSVGSKPHLLIALLRDASGDGDIDATLAAVRAEVSPGGVIAMIANGTRVIFERYSWALGEVYDHAAANAEFTEAIQASEGLYRDRLATAAARISALAPDIDAARAADILWFYFGFRPWRELRTLGWSWDDAEEWPVAQAASALRG